MLSWTLFKVYTKVYSQGGQKVHKQESGDFTAYMLA